MENKKILFLIVILLFCLSLIGEVTKISMGFGQSTLAMENFNDYMQNGMITSQMNFEKIKIGNSINIDIVSSLKIVKHIDLVISIEYITTKTKGSADSLQWWDDNWQNGQEKIYNHYTIPIMISGVYNLSLTSSLLSKFNVAIGSGVGTYIAITYEEWRSIIIDGRLSKTWKNSYFDNKLGFHINSIISYNLSTRYSLGLKMIYRHVNTHNMNDDYDLDYSGFGVNLNIGINF